MPEKGRLLSGLKELAEKANDSLENLTNIDPTIKSAEILIQQSLSQTSPTKNGAKISSKKSPSKSSEEATFGADEDFIIDKFSDLLWAPENITKDTIKRAYAFAKGRKLMEHTEVVNDLIEATNFLLENAKNAQDLKEIYRLTKDLSPLDTSNLDWLKVIKENVTLASISDLEDLIDLATKVEIENNLDFTQECIYKLGFKIKEMEGGNFLKILKISEKIGIGSGEVAKQWKKEIIYLIDEVKIQNENQKNPINEEDLRVLRRTFLLANKLKMRDDSDIKGKALEVLTVLIKKIENIKQAEKILRLAKILGLENDDTFRNLFIIDFIETEISISENEIQLDRVRGLAQKLGAERDPRISEAVSAWKEDRREQWKEAGEDEFEIWKNMGG